MDGKIALEEHWALDETLHIAGQPVRAGARWDELCLLLVEFRDQRLAGMDANGIEFAILGLNGPGLQAILDPAEAADVARRTNDTLATEVALNPGRFAGFAGLPMQDPEAAALELTRCVTELGFKGAMVNCFTQKDVPDSAVYYDLPEFRPFWEGVSKLDVPVFISMGQMMNRGAGREGLDPDPEDFHDELRTMRRWIDRYPDVTLVVTHGLNWRFFMEDDSIVLPEWVWEPFKDSKTYLQLLFPIALGSLWDFPLPQAQPTVAEIVDRLGADRVIWGTDMPIVARSWTYQQNLDFIRVHCDGLGLWPGCLVWGDVPPSGGNALTLDLYGLSRKRRGRTRTALLA